MAETPHLDPAAIAALSSLGPEGDTSFLRELIDIYLADAPQRIAELDAALARGDAGVALRAAHTIKGSSSNFGATLLAHRAQQIEAQCKAGDCAAGLALLPALKAESRLVADELQRLRGA
ncbi:MAG TPA: Hpt domain-containing protein [Lacunisphaera sp.]|nr:Hpt domain-containing protein [Lacunisphaera sp.]